jgi:hypothetical protein
MELNRNDIFEDFLADIGRRGTFFLILIAYSRLSSVRWASLGDNNKRLLGDVQDSSMIVILL